MALTSLQESSEVVPRNVSAGLEGAFIAEGTRYPVIIRLPAPAAAAIDLLECLVYRHLEGRFSGCAV